MWAAGHCHPRWSLMKKQPTPPSGGWEMPLTSSSYCCLPLIFFTLSPPFSAQPTALLPDGWSFHLSALC